MKVFLDTLGCKLNQAETESLARQFASTRHELVSSLEEAQIYVLNTCTVTHIADRKARHLLRLARRKNPKAFIIATGCYAQRSPEEIKKLGMANLILDNESKGHFVEVIEAELNRPQKVWRQFLTPEKQSSLGDPDKFDLRLTRVPTKITRFSWDGLDKGDGFSTFSPPVRTRSLVKIQDGCNDFCSFCIVPYVRGRERSLPLEQVLMEVKSRVASGYKEVVLTGTKVGSYKQDGGLANLIKRILAETRVERLRLSSLQPHELIPELLELWQDCRLCRHLHIPLQSGSETVLKRMRRRYSLSDYERAVSLVRAIIPEVAITTDIIIGFPGESEGEFKESYCFCEKMDFANIHVFPYSPRSGTLAAQMPQVKEVVKKERVERMLELARRGAQRFKARFLGQTMLVLWERKTKEGWWSGLTDNYLRVFTRSNEPLTNRLLPTKLVAEQRLLGEIIREAGNG